MSKISKIIDIKIVGTQELLQLEKAISANEQKLKNMNKASKQNAGMQKIHAKNIVDTKLKLKQLRSERNKESKAILQSQQATVKLDGSYNSLVKRNQQLLVKMKSTTGGIDSNTDSMKKLKKEYADNNSKLKTFDKSIGNSQRNVGNYGSALGNVKEKLATVGMAIGGAVLAFQAVSRVITMVTQDFGEFEKGFTNILSLMSSSDIDKFGERLKSGALDVMQEFGLEIGDMNKALFDAVSAGVPAAESIDFLRAASELAIGGVTNLTTATDGITTVINAFGLETADATEVASAFFSAQKFGKTTVEELSNTIGKVAPIAKQAGVGYKELLSAMAVLTKQGLNTNIATTSLKGAIGALIKPSKEAEVEFQRLGISYGVSGIQGAGFMNILKQIAVAAETDKDALVKLIPNVEALTGVGALGTAQLEDYDAILQQVNVDYGENSSLAAAVAMQQETLEQQQNRLNAEFTKQKILLGEELKPIFSAVIKSLSFIIENAKGIGIALKSSLIIWGAYKASILLTTISLKGLSVASVLATAKQRILNSVVMKNPYVFAATALATLVAGLYAFGAASKEAITIQDRLQKINQDAKDTYSGQISNVEELVKLARNESASTKQRQSAVNKLNKEVKGLNGSMTIQNANTSQVTATLDRYKSAIINAAKAAAGKGEIQNMVDEQTRLNKIIKDNATAFLSFDENTGMPTANSMARVKQMNADHVSASKDLTRQIDQVAASIAKLELENTGYAESITLSQIADKSYAKTIAGTQAKISDLQIAFNNAVNGTQNYRDAKRLLNLEQAKLNKLLDTTVTTSTTLLGVDKMAATTTEEINKKKEAYNLLLKKEVINSENYKAIQLKMIALDEELAKGKLEVTENRQSSIDKINEEIVELEKLESVYGTSVTLEKERTKNSIALAQKRLDLIIAEGIANGELTSTQLTEIGNLKTQIEGLKGSATMDGEEGFMQALFGGGEGGQEILDNTFAGLQAINGLIGQRAALQQAEANARIKVINQEENAEVTSLKKTAKFKAMTSEQQEKALMNIEEKYAGQREIIERKAFEQKKKADKQQAIIAGAMAIMRLAADVPKGDFGIMTGILIAAQIAMTKMQLDTINKAEFGRGGVIEQFGNGGELAGGGVFSGASHKNGGIKFATGGRLMEAEGGEAIINKQSTSMFRNELSAINQAGGGVRFADGGITSTLDGLVQSQQRSMMTDDDVDRIAGAINTQQVVVTESQISSVQKTIRVQESRMSF